MSTDYRDRSSQAESLTYKITQQIIEAFGRSGQTVFLAKTMSFQLQTTCTDALSTIFSHSFALIPLPALMDEVEQRNEGKGMNAICSRADSRLIR